MLPAAVLVTAAAVLVTTVLSPGTASAPESGSVSPRMGADHWHASYEYYVCGVRQPPAPFWPGGVHTHDDGWIHIHPASPEEEGEGARLVKWFEYGGGVLTHDTVRMPGDAVTYTNGMTCPDGSEGLVQVYVNGEPLDRWDTYIPQDGDHVVILFGPPLNGDGRPNAALPGRAAGLKTLPLPVY